MMTKCIVTSKMLHTEQESAISDCHVVDENIDKAPSAEDLTLLVTYAKAQYLQQLDESGWFGLDRALPSDTLRVTKQCVAGGYCGEIALAKTIA